jgi:lysophospholipase L1-like esterase
MLVFGDSIALGGDASAPSLYGYAALGVPVTNHAVGGALMYNEIVPPAIRTQMLAVSPPSRYELVVMNCGTNDMGLYGSDATALAAFKAALQEGLLYLTSRRRIPEPKNARERLLLRQHRLPSVTDGPRVFVGNTPKQIPGSYVGNGSPTVQALYATAVADTVAAVAAQRRRVYLVDMASAYDPVTMDGSLPSGIHPNDTGHAAIAAAFLAVIRSSP